MEAMKIFGGRVRNRRQELGLSMDELAKKVGYTGQAGRTSIYKIETGRQDVPASKVKAIAAALETSEAYLMGVEIREKKSPLSELLSKAKGEPKIVKAVAVSQPEKPKEITLDSLEKLETDQLRRLMIYAEAILKAREIGGGPK
jgi:transcriptional regulator with XRE-family HTH domain